MAPDRASSTATAALLGSPITRATGGTCGHIPSKTPDVASFWRNEKRSGKLIKGTRWLGGVVHITTSDFMTGLTGKTAYKAIWQAFYGAGFNSGTLPGNWSSTANQIERLLYVFKDALCEIDDFKLGNATKVQQKHNDADRVLRNHANKQGRGRLKQNADFAVTYYSRAFPSSSGDDIPVGESLRGRMLIRELQRDDVNLEWLTDAQEKAASCVFARVMSAFLKWLAPQIDVLKKSDATRVLRQR